MPPLIPGEAAECRPYLVLGRAVPARRSDQPDCALAFELPEVALHGAPVAAGLLHQGVHGRVDVVAIVVGEVGECRQQQLASDLATHAPYTAPVTACRERMRF